MKKSISGSPKCGCTEDFLCNAAIELGLKSITTRSIAARKSYSWHRAKALNDTEIDYYGNSTKQIGDYWPNKTYFKRLLSRLSRAKA